MIQLLKKMDIGVISTLAICSTLCTQNTVYAQEYGTPIETKLTFTKNAILLDHKDREAWDYLALLETANGKEIKKLISENKGTSYKVSIPVKQDGSYNVSLYRSGSKYEKPFTSVYTKERK